MKYVQGALLLAMLLNRKFKGRVVYRAIFYFPYMLSWIVIGIIWKWIYNPNIGFLDSLLNLLGIQTSGAGWLSDPKIALYCVFAAALWQGGAKVGIRERLRVHIGRKRLRGVDGAAVRHDIDNVVDLQRAQSALVGEYTTTRNETDFVNRFR